MSNARNLANLLGAGTTIATASIADNAISTAKIAADAVTSAKLDTNIAIAGTLGTGGVITSGGNIIIPNAGTIGSASDTDALSIASDGVTTFSQSPVGVPAGSNNVIINGAMQVAQRSTSVSGLGAATGYFTLDRWEMTEGAASAGRFTMSQSAVTDLAEHPNALKIDCTTADTSIAAGEQLTITQKIEGLNLQQLKATSTSTKAFTVSYYAKSDASRAVVLEILMAEGTNKQISALHTIGTSWARYSMTVPAASSTELDNDATEAMRVNLWLHGGATFTGGTLNTGALAGTTDANRAAGIGSIFADTDNEIEVTGFQIEPGSSATPFQHRSFSAELALCQRYYLQAGGSNYKSVFGAAGWYNTTTSWIGKGGIPVPLRGAPTISYTGTPRVQNGQAGYNISSLSGSLVGDNLTTMHWGAAAATGTLYRAHDMDCNNNAALVKVDAEL
tara:strand:- start:192 stop:1535 length:1344 start_codon:yes stop_codon:yes gene_type:complete